MACKLYGTDLPEIETWMMSSNHPGAANAAESAVEAEQIPFEGSESTHVKVTFSDLTVCEAIQMFSNQLNNTLKIIDAHKSPAAIEPGGTLISGYEGSYEASEPYESARLALLKYMQDNNIGTSGSRDMRELRVLVEGKSPTFAVSSGGGAVTHDIKRMVAWIDLEKEGSLAVHFTYAKEIDRNLSEAKGFYEAHRHVLQFTRTEAQFKRKFGTAQPMIDWYRAAVQLADKNQGLLTWLEHYSEQLLLYKTKHDEICDARGVAADKAMDPIIRKQKACKAMQDPALGPKTVIVKGKTLPNLGGRKLPTWMGGDQLAEDLCPDKYLTENDKNQLKAGNDIKNKIARQKAKGPGAIIAVSQAPTKRTFKEQCLILSHLQEFIYYKHSLDNDGIRVKRLPYIKTTVPIHKEDNSTAKTGVTTNACLMADRQPWGFMNQLVQDPSYAAFFNIKNEHLSQLQPMIKLYKIKTDATNEEHEVEVAFDNAFNSKFDAILGNTKKRGFGVGIQNFVFSYEGSDPFAVKKSIKAKLSIFASSFDDLLIERGGYRYADLALKTGSRYQERLMQQGVKIDKLADLNFRLKAVVGWSMPPGGNIKGITDSENRKLIDAINNSFVTLNLTPTIHEFDISEQGHVVFHINYLAYVDQYFDEASFNIFSDKAVHTRTLIRKNKYAELQKDCGADSDVLDKLKEKMKEEIDNDKKKGLQSIINRMLNYKMIYYKKIPMKDLRIFNMGTKEFKLDLNEAKDMLPDEASAKLMQKTANQKMINEAFAAYNLDVGTLPDLSKSIVKDINGNEYISWFYLSDLIDVIMEGIDSTLKDMATSLENDKGNPPSEPALKTVISTADLKAEQNRLKRVYENYKQFRVLLGPVELVNPKSEKNYFTTNLGDLPIAVSYFMDWLIDKTLKRDTVAYNLPIFLKDLLNNLVRNFLNEDRCFDLNIKQRVRVFSSTVTSYRNPKWGDPNTTDEITEWINQQGGIAGPLPAGAEGAFGGNKSGKIKLRMSEMSTTNTTKGRGSVGRSQVPILHVMGERDTPINTRSFKNTYNYAVFYAGRVQPQKLMSGIESEDAKAGIFHYVLGKPNGIVKSIQLSKTEAPGLKEVRFEQEGYDGLMQLREVYDASITCYGSPNIYPGTYIYVNPRGFAPNTPAYKDDAKWDNTDLSRFGIGGYFMVTHAENKFGPGVCETQITAKWVAQLATKKSEQASGGGTGGERKSAKCVST